MREDHSRHVESASVGGFDATPANGSLVLYQRDGQVRSKDAQAFSWQSFSVALAESSKFFDNTDGGVRRAHSERRKILAPETSGKEE
jgi:hypothetical protein